MQEYFNILKKEDNSGYWIGIKGVLHNAISYHEKIKCHYFHEIEKFPLFITGETFYYIPPEIPSRALLDILKNDLKKNNTIAYT